MSSNFAKLSKIFFAPPCLTALVDCLLSNAIKMRGHHVVLDGDKPVATQFTVSLEKLCGIIRKLLATPSSSSDCLTQVRLGKTACNIPRFRNGVADAPRNHARLFFFGFLFKIFFFFFHITHKLDPCEALAQIVMPVLADATLFALTYGEDFLLKPACGR